LWLKAVEGVKVIMVKICIVRPHVAVDAAKDGYKEAREKVNAKEETILVPIHFPLIAQKLEELPGVFNVTIRATLQKTLFMQPLGLFFQANAVKKMV